MNQIKLQVNLSSHPVTSHIYIYIYIYIYIFFLEPNVSTDFINNIKE